jgi:hypothetical protein
MSKLTVSPALANTKLDLVHNDPAAAPIGISVPKRDVNNKRVTPKARAFLKENLAAS